MKQRSEPFSPFPENILASYSPPNPFGFVCIFLGPTTVLPLLISSTNQTRFESLIFSLNPFLFSGRISAWSLAYSSKYFCGSSFNCVDSTLHFSYQHVLSHAMRVFYKFFVYFSKVNMGLIKICQSSPMVITTLSQIPVSVLCSVCSLCH